MPTYSPPIAELIEFTGKHWSAPGGRQYEVDPDGWLLNQFWRPLHSFRYWPKDPASICDDCRKTAGTLTQDYWSHEPTRTKKHAATGCAGLVCEPIQFVLLNLPRQSGKTVGTSGLVATKIFKRHDQHVAFISGSEDQSAELFRQHYREPIVARNALNRRAKIRGNRIEVPKTSSTFTFLATSLAGTTGGTKTLVVIDEARAVPDAVAIAMMPTIFAQNGWACPAAGDGHTRTKGDLDNPKMTKCATCQTRLQPWVGQVIAMSSAGEMSGGSKDWFFNACDAAEREPSPRVYVHQATGVVGSKVAKSTVDAMNEFFGKVEGLESFVDMETTNQARRRGESFISKAQVDVVVDNMLTNQQAGDRPAVAFLDTSLVGDLTSMVVLADDSTDTEEEWARVVVQRIDIWDPKQLKGGVIDDRVIEQHLDDYVPLFPFVDIRIDTRMMPWAIQLVKRARKEKPYRRIIDGVSWREHERRASWTLLEQRLLARTIRLPPNPTLRKELLAARKSTDLNNRTDVREQSRRKRHLDVAESLAACCYLAHLQAIKPRGVALSATRTGMSAGRRLVASLSSRPITADLGPNKY